jgi:hypothetical protein
MASTFVRHPAAPALSSKPLAEIAENAEIAQHTPRRKTTGGNTGNTGNPCAEPPAGIFANDLKRLEWQPGNPGVGRKPGGNRRKLAETPGRAKSSDARTAPLR